VATIFDLVRIETDDQEATRQRNCEHQESQKEREA